MYLTLYKQTHKILYNMEVNIMANFYDFSSDKISIYMFLVDSSGSMSDDADNVIKGLKGYKKSFESFPDVNSISVSISKFNGGVFLNDLQRKVKWILAMWLMEQQRYTMQLRKEQNIFLNILRR